VGKRRGAFPRVPFKSVLELVDGIYELGQGDPVRRRLAFEHIGRSPDSSISYTLNSAATSGYGVVKGGKNASHLELTQSGQRVANRASTGERREVILDILFSNPYFSALVEKYAERPMPQDSIAVDYLQREQGLEQSDAEILWSVAKDNILDFGLYEGSRGKQVILSRESAGEINEGAREKHEDGTAKQEQQNATSESNNSIEASESATGGRVLENTSANGIIPQIAFNIQVVLPENAPAETYNAILKHGYPPARSK